jgi:hypothetical protein
MSAYQGLRSTTDWQANQVPESWEEFILREQPNGMSPLFALQSMLPTETVDSYKFNWWTKTLPVRSLDVTADEVYIDSGLSTKYVRATHQATIGIAGGVVYVKVDATATGNDFNFVRLKQGVVLRDASRMNVDVSGSIVDFLSSGANSYIAVELNEADDNDADPTTYNLTTVDRVLFIGAAFEENSAAPSGLVYDPVEYDNLTQIFRNTFEISRTAKSTRLRTGNGYLEDKMDTLELISMDIEWQGWLGQKRTATGNNNKPKRFTQGCIPWLREHNPSAVRDFRIDYAAQTWLDKGKTWLNEYIKVLFRYAAGKRILAHCGDGALMGINELAEYHGWVNLTVGQNDFGLEVTSWRTPFGIIDLKTHPLFSQESTMQYCMVCMVPKNAKAVPLVGGGESGQLQFQEGLAPNGTDGDHDGWLAEIGWKFKLPNQWLVLFGVGQDG